MKHFNKLFATTLLFVGLASQAQDNVNPWAVSFGANAVDTRVSASRGGLGLFEKTFSQGLDMKDNWNIVPAVSYLSVSKYVGDGFSFGMTGSFNKITKYVDFKPTTIGADGRGMVVSNPGDLNYYGLDAAVSYSFKTLLKSALSRDF